VTQTLARDSRWDWIHWSGLNQSPLFAETIAAADPIELLPPTMDYVLDLPARTGNFVLWLEAEPEGRFHNFRLQIYTADKKLAQTVAGLRRNAYGAVAVSLPAAAFQTGKYLVGLYGVGAHESELVGEYTLQIRKH